MATKTKTKTKAVGWLVVAAALVAARPARADELVIGIYAPTAGFASSSDRLSYVSALAKAIEGALGGGTTVKGQSFSSLSQMAGGAQFGILDPLCAAGNKYTVMATATVNGKTEQTWALYAKGASNLPALKDKAVAYAKTGCNDQAFIENALLESEVPASFFKLSAKDAITGAVTDVASGGSQAVFAPPLGGTKGLTKVFDVGSVPNPAFVQLSSKVDAAVAAKVKAAVLGFAQRSALDGWKGAESYGSLAGRMGKRTKRPIFAPPQRIRLADPDVLEVAGVGAPATPDIKNHFWAP